MSGNDCLKLNDLQRACMVTAEHSGADAAFEQAREDSSGIA